MPKVIPKANGVMKRPKPTRSHLVRKKRVLSHFLSKKAQFALETLAAGPKTLHLSQEYQDWLGGNIRYHSLNPALNQTRVIQNASIVGFLGMPVLGYLVHSTAHLFPIIFLFAGLFGGHSEKRNILMQQGSHAVRQHEKIAFYFQNNYSGRFVESGIESREDVIHFMVDWMSQFSTEDCPISLSDFLKITAKYHMGTSQLIQILKTIITWPEFLTELTSQEIGLFIWQLENTLKDLDKNDQTDFKVNIGALKLKLFVLEKSKDPHFANIIIPLDSDQEFDTNSLLQQDNQVLSQAFVGDSPEFDFDLTGESGAQLLLNSANLLAHPHPQVATRMINLHAFVLQQLRPDLKQQVLDDYVNLIDITKQTQISNSEVQYEQLLKSVYFLFDANLFDELTTKPLMRAFGLEDINGLDIIP